MSSQRGVLLAVLKQPILRAGAADAPMLVHTGGELSTRTVRPGGVGHDIDAVVLLICVRELACVL